MSANKTQYTIDNELIRRINELEKNVRELRSASQPIGVDSLAMSSFTFSTGGALTVAAGTTGHRMFTLDASATGQDSREVLWLHQESIFVDGTSTADYYPWGGNLTAAKRHFSFNVWQDLEYSDNALGQVVFYVQISNHDSSSHDYYITLKANYPYLPGVVPG